jgi:hypothetical protein
MTTVADVLAELKKQLDWVSPKGEKTSHVTLSREEAEHLHRVVLDVIKERDDVVFELENIRAPKAALGTSSGIRPEDAGAFASMDGKK